MLRQLLKVFLISLRKSIQNIIIIRDYLEKKKKSFTRIGVSIWNSIPVKTFNISNFRKKIKSLLLIVLGNEDNYLNVNYLIEYFVKLT